MQLGIGLPTLEVIGTRLHTVPAKGQMGSELCFSWPMSGRDEIIQICRDALPGTQFSDAFCHLVNLKNLDYRQRAICLNDWTAANPVPIRPPTCMEQQVDSPLYEILNRMLPSPSIFAEMTYSLRLPKIASVEMGNLTSGLEYENRFLQARVGQYVDNKRTLEDAIVKRKLMMKGIVAPLSQDALHKTLFDEKQQFIDAGLPQEHRLTEIDKLLQGEHMLFVILRNWELKRDIERLEAAQRNVSEARMRAVERFWILEYSVWRMMEWRHGLESIGEDDVSSQDMSQRASVNNTDEAPHAPDSEQHVRELVDNGTNICEMEITRPKISTKDSSQSRPFPYDDNTEWRRDLETRVSCSVCHDVNRDQARPRSDQVPQHSSCSPLEVAQSLALVKRDEIDGEKEIEIPPKSSREKKDSASTERILDDMKQWFKRGSR